MLGMDCLTANTPHLNPLPYTTTASRRLGSLQGERKAVDGEWWGPASRERHERRGKDAQRRVPTKALVGDQEAPLRFCETNPFYFRVNFVISILDIATYVVCSRVCKWVRFGKRTHF